MKLALLLLGLSALAVTSYSSAARVSTTQHQLDVLHLLWRVNQPSQNSTLVQIANSFNISEHQSDFSNVEAVQQFVDQYENNRLQRGEIFSIFNHEHLAQVIALFRVFYYASNYQTFYNLAVWARQNVNEGLFVYTFSVAVVHRPETQNVVLPPIYEVYPHYFFNSEVIQQAYQLRQTHVGQQPAQDGTRQTYTIQSNYSGYYLNLHPEQSLSYYLEDIGINSYYYYFNLYSPFWLNETEFGIVHPHRGEQYYFLYQQLVARFYLERRSEGFGEIPWFNWDVPIETSYYPSLEYPNGLQFPARPALARLQESYSNHGQSGYSRGPYAYSYTLVQDYERRIQDAVDRGYIYHDGQRINLNSREGINILGNLIQGNPSSIDAYYYGGLWLYASHLLGYSYIPLNQHQVAPSALEHFETALRDPIFYQLYRRILSNFLRLSVRQPSYTARDLTYSGVRITNVQFDKLVTYFESFYSDLSNAVFYSPEEINQYNFNLRVNQQRLNNRPFNYRITVNSQEATNAVVKIFLAPVNDEYGRYFNISQNRLNLVLFDYFLYNLTAGENVITRNSYDNPLYGPDPTSFNELYRQASSGQNGGNNFQQNYLKFPQRYILPQGSRSGIPYQFYVFVYPQSQQTEPQQNQGHIINSYFFPSVGENQYFDSVPLGYPFDRRIAYDGVFEQLPNFYAYQTNVYHRTVEEINSSTAEH